MAGIANSSSCSCLLVPIKNLLPCFGFESNDPGSGVPAANTEANKSSSIQDETIIEPFPPGNNNNDPVSKDSSVRDETIIGVFPCGKESVNPISEESSAADETIIRVFPGGKDEAKNNPISEDPSARDETIIDVFPGGNDEAKSKPSSEDYPSSDGWKKWMKDCSGIDVENNTSFEEPPSSTDEQPPVTGGDFVVPEVIIPGDWGRKEPEKRNASRGAPGRTS